MNSSRLNEMRNEEGKGSKAVVGCVGAPKPRTCPKKSMKECYISPMLGERVNLFCFHNLTFFFFLSSVGHLPSTSTGHDTVEIRTTYLPVLS